MGPKEVSMGAEAAEDEFFKRENFFLSRHCSSLSDEFRTFMQAVSMITGTLTNIP